MPYQETMSFDDIWQVINSRTEERMIYFIKFLEGMKEASDLVELSDESIMSTAATMTVAATTELLIATLAGQVDDIKGLK